MGLRSDILAAVLRYLPNSDSVLDQSDPRFATLLGGLISAGVWKRFSTGYGTTCSTVVDGILLEVSAPPELIDAATEDGGSGFTPGASFSRMMSGAKSLGWYRDPVRGQLPNFQPGDIYIVNHTDADGGTNNAHMGIIVSSTPSSDGKSLSVETADAGQGTRTDQQFTRQMRTFSLGKGNNAIDFSSKFTSGWLEFWVDVPDDGDTPAAPADTEPPAGGDQGDDGAGLVLGLTALGSVLLVAGLAWYARENTPRDWPLW